MKRRTTLLIDTENFQKMQKIVMIRTLNGKKISMTDWINQAIAEKIERDGMPVLKEDR